jgi:hypothetical protein
LLPAFFLFYDTSNAQSNHAGSLDAVLAHTSNPMERFYIIRNDLGLINASKADNVNSASCAASSPPGKMGNGKNSGEE